MKKTCKILLWFLLIFSCSGCFKSIHLSKEDLLEEYDYLWHVLEENYMYFDLLANKGISKEQVRSSYRNRIQDNTTMVEYYRIIGDMIMEFQFEGHIQLYDIELYFSTKSLYDREIAKQGMNLTYLADLTYLAIYDSGVEKTYQYLASELDIDLLSKQEESNDTSYFVETPLQIEEWEELNTLYISIDSFSYVDMEDNISLIRTKMQEKQYENIIMDIRDNSGGSTMYWLNLLSLILREEIEINRTLGFSGDESYRYLEFISNIDMEIENTTFIIEDNTLIHKRKIDIDTTVQKPNQLYVLSSKQNYSATDDFLRAVKDYELGTIIGTISGGSGGSGLQPMQIKLPNSKLIMEFEPAIVLEDGEPIRYSGVEPDVSVYSNQAYEICLDMIREQQLY